MVILDPNLGRAVLRLAEDDPPLIVDAYGVEAVQTALQGFESVSRWHGEVAELTGLIELDEFSQGHAKDGCIPAISLLMEELLGVSIGE